MNEMVERVAEAMWLEDTQDVKWEFAQRNYAPGYRVRARAAIAAMREPTEAMVRAGDLAQTEARGPKLGAQVAMASSVPWRAMIDAALVEPQER